jgi:hypothetical protein
MRGRGSTIVRRGKGVGVGVRRGRGALMIGRDGPVGEMEVGEIEIGIVMMIGIGDVVMIIIVHVVEDDIDLLDHSMLSMALGVVE